jgi:hypothetical protein
MAWVWIGDVRKDVQCGNDLKKLANKHFKDNPVGTFWEHLPLDATCADKPLITGRDFIILVALRDSEENSLAQLVTFKSRCCFSEQSGHYTKVHILWFEIERKALEQENALSIIAQQMGGFIPLHEITKKEVEIQVEKQNNGGEENNNSGDNSGEENNDSGCRDALLQLRQWFAGFFMAYRYRVKFKKLDRNGE